jgi:hypothetical protein
VVRNTLKKAVDALLTEYFNVVRPVLWVSENIISPTGRNISYILNFSFLDVL